MNKKLKQIPILSLLLFTPFLAFCQIPEKRETNKLAINDIPESNIYWLGESHGTRKNYGLAYQLYTYIDSAKHIDYFLTECGFLQAHYLNQYIISGDTNKLNAAFRLNTGTFGWTKEHKSFYESIYHHEKTKSITDRIKFIDIDIEHGYWNTHRYLLDSLVPRRISDTTLVLSKINSAIKIGNEYNAYYNSLYNDMIKRESAYKSILNQNFETLKYIVRNICYIKFCQGQPDKDWDKLRDSLIYKNFSYKNSYLNFKDYKSFAFWGNDHVLQAETKTDVRFIASRIKRNNPEIMQTSFYTLYSDCHFNTPTFFYRVLLDGFMAENLTSLQKA